MHIDNLADILRQHPFLAGLSDKHMEVLVGCASNAHFPDGGYLIHEGQIANKFFLIRTGRIALEIDVSPRGPLRIQTVGPGDVLGWSWLIPPYTWHFDARALELTRAIALDGKCLRKKIEADHELGYVVMKRFSELMVQRFQVTRLQLLDMYGNRD